MINDAVERLLERAEPYLAAHMIDKIKVKVRPDLDGLEVIELNPPPIKPYVEYVKTVNRVPSDGIKVKFNVVFGLKLEDIRFRKVDNRQTETHIDKLTIYVTMSIVEIVVSILQLPTISFRGSMLLCDQQLFRAENLVFHL